MKHSLTSSAGLVLFLFFYADFPVVPFGTEAGDTLALLDGGLDGDGFTPVITLPIAFPLFGEARIALQVSKSTNKLSHSPSPTVNYSEHCTQKLHFCSVS